MTCPLKRSCLISIDFLKGTQNSAIPLHFEKNYKASRIIPVSISSVAIGSVFIFLSFLYWSRVLCMNVFLLFSQVVSVCVHVCEQWEWQGRPLILCCGTYIQECTGMHILSREATAQLSVPWECSGLSFSRIFSTIPSQIQSFNSVLFLPATSSIQSHLVGVMDGIEI